MRLLKIMWKCWLAELAAQAFTILAGVACGVFWFIGMELMNFWYFILGFVCLFLMGIGVLFGDMINTWEKNLREEYEKMLDNPKEL